MDIDELASKSAAEVLLKAREIITTCADYRSIQTEKMLVNALIGNRLKELKTAEEREILGKLMSAFEVGICTRCSYRVQAVILGLGPDSTAMLGPGCGNAHQDIARFAQEAKARALQLGKEAKASEPTQPKGAA